MNYIVSFVYILLPTCRTMRQQYSQLVIGTLGIGVVAEKISYNSILCIDYYMSRGSTCAFKK